MDRYRRLGMEYRFHDDAGTPRAAAQAALGDGAPADADAAGAVAFDEGVAPPGEKPEPG